MTQPPFDPELLSSPTGYSVGGTQRRMPALDLLVGRIGEREYGVLDGDGTPLECVSGCPFAGPRSVEPYDLISNDPSEAHYPCRMLKRVVWGEHAPCERKDWQAAARAELGSSTIPS